jgi:hypothetical protein
LALEVVHSQVHAIAQLVQGLGGQVASVQQRASLGQSGVLSVGQLMLADAMRLAALLQDPSLLSLDELAPSWEAELHNVAPMEMLLEQVAQRQEEVERLRAQIEALEMLLDALQEQVALVMALTQSLSALMQQEEGKDPIFQQLLDALQGAILPELLELKRRVEAILEELERAAVQREDEIDHLEDVYKFVLPWLRALRRAKRQRLELARAKAAREGEALVQAPVAAQAEKAPEGGEVVQEGAEQEALPDAQTLDAQEREAKEKLKEAVAQRQKRVGARVRQALERLLDEPAREDGGSAREDGGSAREDGGAVREAGGAVREGG